jgi:hypothetical protein
LSFHGLEPQAPGDLARIAEAIERGLPRGIRLIGPAKFALHRAFQVIREFIENVAAEIRRFIIER